MNTKPTIKQLNDSWESFLKSGIYQDQRFGQWFYNDHKYEVGNSYNMERPYQVYQLLYNDLATILDEVLENTKIDKLTTDIFVLEFDIHTLQGVLEVNDLTVSFVVSSLQELKEEYGTVFIADVVDTFSEEVVNVEFSKDVLEMFQDSVYEYAVEVHKSYYGDE